MYVCMCTRWNYFRSVSNLRMMRAKTNSRKGNESADKTSSNVFMCVCVSVCMYVYYLLYVQNDNVTIINVFETILQLYLIL